VISSDFPGEVAESAFPLQAARARWSKSSSKRGRGRNQLRGRGLQLQHGLTTDPAKPYQTGGPLLYFGGYSPAAVDLCGQHCDVYLMWPETKDQIAERMKDVAAQATEKYGRTLDYGLRVHMIVRDTEAEAREYADHLVSKLDDEYGN
jgi:alkanesulfonate monooxygenase